MDTQDKQRLDKLWTLHTVGVPIALVLLGGGFIWWRSKQRGPTLGLLAAP